MKTKTKTKINRLKSNLIFIILSVVIISTALFLHHTAETARQKERELLEELSLITRAVEAAQQELELLEQENETLKEILVNRALIYEIVATGAQVSMRDNKLLSRSGRDESYTLMTAATMPVTQPSGLSVAFFERTFAGVTATNLQGTGEALILAEKTHGINSLILASIIIHESAWGKSTIAKQKNNLAGLNATDCDPQNNAFYFESKAASIMHLAKLLAEDYVPGGRFYGGQNGEFDLRGIGVRYAADVNWADKVAGVMRYVVEMAERGEG